MSGILPITYENKLCVVKWKKWKVKQSKTKTIKSPDIGISLTFYQMDTGWQHITAADTCLAAGWK